MVLAKAGSSDTLLCLSPIWGQQLSQRREKTVPGERWCNALNQLSCMDRSPVK